MTEAPIDFSSLSIGWHTMLSYVEPDRLNAGEWDMLNRQQVVVEKLRQLVISGELASGDRLAEIALSEKLGVSRTPIREALIVLAEEGLVEYRHNRGYIVRTFDIGYILDAYAVREVLETLTARLAAQNGIGGKTEAALLQCLRAGDALLSTERLTYDLQAPWRDINNEFHALMLDAANNAALGQALRITMNIPFASTKVVHWFDDGDVEGLNQLRSVHAQHWAIYNAIKARDAHAAETAMRWHLSYAINHIKGKYVHELETVNGHA